jgi:predicted alpha/beta-hydrolase family hydrolase
MTSQAQAKDPLPRVRGLLFLAFPLHPAGQPGVDRAAHLREIGIPMLFIQGTRDELATLSLLQPLIGRLGNHAHLHLLEDADHSFHVPARSGRTDPAVLDVALDAASDWLGPLTEPARR